MREVLTAAFLALAFPAMAQESDNSTTVPCCTSIQANGPVPDQPKRLKIVQRPYRLGPDYVRPHAAEMGFMVKKPPDGASTNSYDRSRLAPGRGFTFGLRGKFPF